MTAASAPIRGSSRLAEGGCGTVGSGISILGDGAVGNAGQWAELPCAGAQRQ
jgi:hypothetical protein